MTKSNDTTGNIKYKLVEGQKFYRLRHKETGKFYHPASRQHGQGKLYPRKPSISYAAGQQSYDYQNWEVVEYMLVEIVHET